VRISFGGGGTDLPAYYEQFGGAVLSTAIDKYFYTVLRELNCKVSIDLFLASEIPPGTGLGSSATVCVNVLKLMSSYTKQELSRYELAERGYHIARNVLKQPVGKQDEYAAAFGGLNYIQFHKDGGVTVEPIVLSADLSRQLQSNLMLFFTGASHNSWDILKTQEDSTKKHSGTSVTALHEIRELADTMRDVLRKGEIDRFGDLLHAGWEAKKRVSEKISTSNIDELYEMARRNGAVGGKITGAGGGGFMLLYVRERDQQSVRDAFAAKGLREMNFGFDRDGAQVIINDPFLDSDSQTGMSWDFIPYESGFTAEKR